MHMPQKETFESKDSRPEESSFSDGGKCSHTTDLFGAFQSGAFYFRETHRVDFREHLCGRKEVAVS